MTTSWDDQGLEGLYVTVKVTVQNRQAKVSIVPSATTCIIKALKEPERDRKKVKEVHHRKAHWLEVSEVYGKIMLAFTYISSYFCSSGNSLHSTTIHGKRSMCCSH
jgi:hypothetical protein